MADYRLRSCNLNVAIADLPLVSDLNLEIRPGEFVCVIGRNGAGKSTLMHTLAGLRPTDNSAIDLQGQALDALPRAQVARRIALLAQHHEDAFPGTVMETVLLGRHPHLGFWDWESGHDEQVARDALASVELSALAQRDIATLSGGERQRVALATVLTQQAGLYLLDEPLNNLDPHHQLGVLRLFRSLCEQGATTIAILHDLNLVSRFADKVLLLFGPENEGEWMYGSLDDCMTSARLSRLYNTSIERFTRDGRILFVAA